MKISASFLKSENIPRDLRKLNDTDVDFIHVDILDGKFVPKLKTMPFRQMKHIYEFTSKRLDVHLMVENPKKYISKYATLNTAYITIHEEIEEVEEALSLIHSYAIGAGLSIKLETPVERVIPYLKDLDLILIMGVAPGRGGQEFEKEAISKVKELRKVLKKYHSKVLISVDGGVTDVVAKKLKEADILVSGSFITEEEDFQKQIDLLRK